jgi:8-oxo-dGTP diphosphatase
VRELQEELGITALDCRPLIRVPHDYPDKRVLLDVWRVTRYRGEAHGLEGQPLYRLRLDQLEPKQFPAANRPIITALKLPSQCLITGQAAAPSEFLARLQASLDAGVRLVQLRAHQLEDRDYRQLAAKVLPLCRQAGARLLLNRAPGAVQGLEADGVHLNSHQLGRLGSDQLQPWRTGLIGASCHNLDELKQAQRLGVDYALLSPVLPTASHPEQQGIGWHRFAQWVEQVDFPVYALGGMTAEQEAMAIAQGGQGVAAIGAFWGESKL